MAGEVGRDRGRVVSGVVPRTHPRNQRLHEAMELLGQAYYALAHEDPPLRGRAAQCLRKAVAVLSAVAEPHTARAARIAAFLRDADVHGNVLAARGHILTANAALLELDRDQAEGPGRVGGA